MHCLSLRLNLVLGLDLILAHAQPDNFLSTPNEPVDKTYLNSDEFTSSVPDFALNQSNQGETGFLVDANDPFASTNVLNLITLSDSCGTEDSLTNGVLRARDGTPCASQEDQVDLPIGLFQDPEGYLRENLPAPPVGQTGQSGQENKEDGDLGFAAFMRNRLRPVSISPESNEQICDPKKFGISNTPMCSNPFTGSVARDTSFSFMLLDAVPCKCIIPYFGRDYHLS